MDDIPEQYFKIYIRKHYFVFNFNIHDFMWSVTAKTAERRKGKEVFYLMTHSTHFIYGYMVSDIW